MASPFLPLSDSSLLLAAKLVEHVFNPMLNISGVFEQRGQSNYVITKQEHWCYYINIAPERVVVFGQRRTTPIAAG